MPPTTLRATIAVRSAAPAVIAALFLSSATLPAAAAGSETGVQRRVDELTRALRWTPQSPALKVFIGVLSRHPRLARSFIARCTSALGGIRTGWQEPESADRSNREYRVHPARVIQDTIGLVNRLRGEYNWLDSSADLLHDTPPLRRVVNLGHEQTRAGYGVTEAQLVRETLSAMQVSEPELRQLTERLHSPKHAKDAPEVVRLALEQHATSASASRALDRPRRRQQAAQYREDLTRFVEALRRGDASAWNARIVIRRLFAPGLPPLLDPNAEKTLPVAQKRRIMRTVLKATGLTLEEANALLAQQPPSKPSFGLATNDRNTVLPLPHYSDERFRQEQTVFGERSAGLAYEYSDRIRQWDSAKADEADRIATESGAPVRSAAWYETYLSAVLGRKVQIKHIVAGVNHSNGYPYAVLGYTSAEK